MSYITTKYEAGDVNFQGLAIGWYFEETHEFRPLMVDAVMELYTKGYIDEDIVYATSIARDEYNAEFLNNYEPEPLTTEELYEMHVAFGDDDPFANILNGEILYVEQY